MSYRSYSYHLVHWSTGPCDQFVACPYSTNPLSTYHWGGPYGSKPGTLTSPVVNQGVPGLDPQPDPLDLVPLDRRSGEKPNPPWTS